MFETPKRPKMKVHSGIYLEFCTITGSGYVIVLCRLRHPLPRTLGSQSRYVIYVLYRTQLAWYISLPSGCVIVLYRFRSHPLPQILNIAGSQSRYAIYVLYRTQAWIPYVVRKNNVRHRLYVFGMVELDCEPAQVPVVSVLQAFSQWWQQEWTLSYFKQEICITNQQREIPQVYLCSGKHHRNLPEHSGCPSTRICMDMVKTARSSSYLYRFSHIVLSHKVSSFSLLA